MTIHFGYNKKQVIQALRYHFLSRREIKILLILINVFAILAAVLFAMGKVQPIAFLLFSVMWFTLMLAIWTLLPRNIYKKAFTFQDQFSMTFDFDADHVLLQNSKGSQRWLWTAFSSFVESPFFFHLYFDSKSFFLVPKDAFPDLLMLQEARAMLKGKIG
jgi:small-conductance mechanosensitive channel